MDSDPEYIDYEYLVVDPPPASTGARVETALRDAAFALLVYAILPAALLLWLRDVAGDRKNGDQP